MKKLLFLLAALSFSFGAMAQKREDAKKAKKEKNVNVSML